MMSLRGIMRLFMASIILMSLRRCWDYGSWNGERSREYIMIA
jgi:hypothetical protein